MGHYQTVEEFWNRFEPIPECGCWVWTGKNETRGYSRTSFQKQRILIHRLAWQLTYGTIPKGMLVLHRCDTRCCGNPKHLFLGTNLDNIKDALNKRRFSHGINHFRAHLTEGQVIAIRQDTRTTRVIANAYGICSSTVSTIKRRVSWKYLPDNIEDAEIPEGIIE